MASNFTCEVQDSLPVLTVDIVFIVIDAVVHILVRVCTLLQPHSALDVVDVGVDAEQWTLRAAEKLVGTGPPHEFSSVWFLKLLAGSLADAVGEARVALTTANCIVGVVLAGRVVGCDIAIGIVAGCRGDRDQLDKQDGFGDKMKTHSVSH